MFQVSVTGPAGTAVELRGEAEEVVRTGAIDHFGDRLTLGDLGVTDGLKGLGGLVLRQLDPGRYTLVLGAAGETGSSGSARVEVPVTVLDPAVLPEDFDARVRGQRLDPGHGYVEVRDGATLSCFVALPDPDHWGPGPYPALVQYSGYYDSRPGFVSGRAADDVHLNTEANVALLLGYAVVGVAQRGTGGSEGSFLLFEDIHGTDGYDVVEAVAAQSWAAGGPDGRPAVGMIGRSMPGYTQLLTASFAPPSLAAITPAAVGGRPVGSAGRPGGIPNTAMARGIAGWQIDPVEPIRGEPQLQPPRYRPGGWDDWVPARIAGGDATCERNQLLRGQNVDAVPGWTSLEHEEGGMLAHADAERWVGTVRLPALLLGSWQDQLSGPWFADLVTRFPSDADLRVFAFNGAHEETRLPLALGAAMDFLALHLRGEPPRWTIEAQDYLDEVLRPNYPEGLPVREDRFEGLDHAVAMAAFEARPRFVIAFDNGAAPGRPPGYPYAAFEVGFDEWPPAEAEGRRWFLAAGNELCADAPADGGERSFRYVPEARPRMAAGDGFDANSPQPSYDWRAVPEGVGLQLATDPFDESVLVVGPSSLDLWLRSNAEDLDLEVVLSEVRPDSWETYLQAGWLRVSCRHLDPAWTTELHPRLSYRASEARGLPPDTDTLVRVPIGWVGHHLRAGSRLGITIGAAGGNQVAWDLDALHPTGRTADGREIVVHVATGGPHASSLVVPIVDTWHCLDGAPVAELPPIGALRLQPSRPWGPAAPSVGAQEASATPVASLSQRGFLRRLRRATRP